MKSDETTARASEMGLLIERPAFELDAATAFSHSYEDSDWADCIIFNLRRALGGLGFFCAVGGALSWSLLIVAVICTLLLAFGIKRVV